MIAVTGATGWIGVRTVRLLREQGIAVRRLVRRTSIPEDRPFDLTGPSTDWASYLHGCEAIIHCAARVHIQDREDPAGGATCDEVNAKGTQRLLNIAAAAGVSRFVFVSTIAVYDWSHPGPLLESGPLRPTTAYARSKLDAETAVRNSPLDWRICRLATVFGAGDKANFARLARALRKGTFILPGDGHTRKSLIPIDTAAEVITRAATDGSWSKAVVNVSLEKSPSLLEICRGFEQWCGFRRARRLPLSMMKPIALLGSICNQIGIRTPFNQSILTKLTTDTVVDSGRLRELADPKVCSRSFYDELGQHASYYRNC